MKEAKEKNVGLTLDWNLNKHTNQLDFSYNKKSHSEDAIRSFILGLRLFIQDNESISLHKMKLLYDKMNIDDKYKVHFNYLRDELNRYLDEPATTLFEDRPTRRELCDKIIYGKYAHKNSQKKNKVKEWQLETFDWDLAFNQFEQTLHDFAYLIELIKRLNEKVLLEFPEQ